MIRLVRATERHLAGIMAVMAESFDPRFGEGWAEPQVAGALAADDRVGAVALSGDAVAGFALARAAADEAELLLVAVARRFRRCGVGAALISEVEAQVRARGAATMFLEVRDANAPAAALYARQGFEPVGRRKGYYGGTDQRRYDAITMRRALASVQ